LAHVATNSIWNDVYDRLAALVHEHRSTLVFVNTRRLAETDFASPRGSPQGITWEQKQSRLITEAFRGKFVSQPKSG
jgi:replicative superfamily II helicase